MVRVMVRVMVTAVKIPDDLAVDMGNTRHTVCHVTCDYYHLGLGLGLGLGLRAHMGNACHAVLPLPT